jgi:hypothetical protein
MVAVFALRKPAPRAAAQPFESIEVPPVPAARSARAEFSQRENLAALQAGAVSSGAGSFVIFVFGLVRRRDLAKDGPQAGRGETSRATMRRNICLVMRVTGLSPTTLAKKTDHYVI